MQNSPMLHIGRFAALGFTQILVLNNVQFGGYLNPYIYILFILLLPLRTPPLVMILSGFAMGMFIDLFTGMMGLHTAATLFVAFYRKRIMKVVIGVREEDYLGTPGIRDLGSWRFFYYVGAATLIHHLLVYMLEVFTFVNFWSVMVRTLANSMVSVVFIMVAMVLFERRRHG